MKNKNKNQPRYFQFSFLPYIPLKDDLKIGNVLLWSFYKKKDRYIKNMLIKEQLEKIFKQYVKNPKRLGGLENITIASYKSPSNFKPLTKKQAREIRDVAIILCFSTIIRNKSWWAFSSDDFQLIYQKFITGSDSIEVSSGSFIERTVSGFKIDEVLFITPFYICNGYDLDYDEEILRALEQLQQDKKNREFYRRIITSLEWVDYAYTNVDNFKYDSRIVMMATAFEILLDGFGGKFEFMEKINKLTCNSLDDYHKMRSTREIYYEGKKQRKKFSFKEWWAYEFYDLRSRIVHGKEVRNKDIRNRKGNAYFLLAIKFFEECLKKILAAQNYYSYDEVDQIFWAGIYEEI